MPDMPLTPDELLTTTRSVRKRLDLTRPVPLDLVKECPEIALQAPSGGMRQGWQWMVATDPEVRAQIGIWPTCSTGLTPATNIRFSRARCCSVAIQPSPIASVGAIHRSTPCAYMWNRASGM